MPSAQNAQALPSIDPGLRPSHYRTILPNLSYPYSPNSHILCSGSSAPLLFSVSQTFLFMFVIRLTPFALRKPRVLVWRQPPLLPPVYKLVILFFFNVIVNPTLTSFAITSRLPLRICVSILVQSQMFSRELAYGLGWGWPSSCLRSSPDFFLFSPFFCLKNNLSTIVRKLKLIWQKLFGFRCMSPPTSAANIWTCSHLAFPILLKKLWHCRTFLFFLTFCFFSWYRNILLPNLIIMSNISRCSHSTLSLGNFLCI